MGHVHWSGAAGANWPWPPAATAPSLAPVLTTTEAWRATFPGAVVAALVMRGVRNPERDDALEAAKRALEAELRSGAPAPEPVLRAYAEYYRARGGKTYHVRAQRESVALKGKPIPSRAALVEAMFMAELATAVLTAGHDLDTLDGGLSADVTTAGDRYALLSGKQAELEAGDMKMSDGAGIVSSVLRGPDRRTRITPSTRNVVFAAYAPAGIGEEAVRTHLLAIRANVLLIAPDADSDVVHARALPA
jgi:DNA/RNA-binding domain of Phe-tRNA-synthetase-like protein